MNHEHLLKSLLALPAEAEWVEFKHNNDSPDEIGEYVSALANSAALHGREAGHLVWGVEDGTHRIVGTTAQPRQRKVGNEGLENWLAHLLSPRVDFRFHEWEQQGLRMALLQVQPAVEAPVAFKGTEWVRVGSHKKKLKDHPGKEKDLWLALSRLTFEKGTAASDVAGDNVLALLDYPKFFEISGQNLPTNRSGILERLTVDRLIVPKGEDLFDITNLGAILFAAFDALQIRLQQTPLGAALPYQLFLALPYILSILALILMSRRAEVPASLMVPYNKGER